MNLVKIVLSITLTLFSQSLFAAPADGDLSKDSEACWAKIEKVALPFLEVSKFPAISLSDDQELFFTSNDNEVMGFSRVVYISLSDKRSSHSVAIRYKWYEVPGYQGVGENVIPAGDCRIQSIN